MKRSLGSSPCKIGSFTGVICHDEYQSQNPDFRQELCFELGRGFFLRQRWPYDYPGGRVTEESVSWSELPDIFECIEGIPEIPKYQLHELLNLALAGYTQEKISGFMGIPVEKVKNRFVILQRILKGSAAL